MRWRCRPGYLADRGYLAGPGYLADPGYLNASSRTTAAGGIDGGPCRRRAVSPDRAAPAQPRHLCRVVLRSRLRLCGHADLAHAAGALYAARRIAGHAAVPRGVVGVGLHLLDHQLARSRKDSSPAAAVCDDAGRAGAVDLDPVGV